MVPFIKKYILREKSSVFPASDSLAGCSHIENQLNLSCAKSWAKELLFA